MLSNGPLTSAPRPQTPWPLVVRSCLLMPQAPRTTWHSCQAAERCQAAVHAQRGADEAKAAAVLFAVPHPTSSIQLLIPGPPRVGGAVCHQRGHLLRRPLQHLHSHHPYVGAGGWCERVHMLRAGGCSPWAFGRLRLTRSMQLLGGSCCALDRLRGGWQQLRSTLLSSATICIFLQFHAASAPWLGPPGCSLAGSPAGRVSSCPCSSWATCSLSCWEVRSWDVCRAAKSGTSAAARDATPLPRRPPCLLKVKSSQETCKP